MNSKVQVNGMVTKDAERNKGVIEALVSFDQQGHNLRIVASGPAGDSLANFLRGHPIRIEGELAIDAKGLFVLAHTIAAGNR
jgi:glutamate synthase domain-containing protein 3